MQGKPIRLKSPPRLRPGDTIGVAAPASPFEMETFQQGIAALESMGFQVLIAEDVYERSGYLAGSGAQRAGHLIRLFKDPRVNGIICARGGFGSMKILSLLDYDIIGRHPKIFVGFSDISALLTTLVQSCQMVAFHGPTITTLGHADHATLCALKEALSSDNPIEIRAEQGVVIRSGRACGRVSGGNLTTLCHLVGTPFAPWFKDRILLLEDKGEAPYRIDRMLTQMKMAGCFDGIAGLALGSFEGCGPLDEIYNLVELLFRKEKITILGGLPIGHGQRNLTLPMGLAATLDTDRQTLAFLEPATAAG
jgi:muramoyltetrapeptide carboxypeptidase